MGIPTSKHILVGLGSILSLVLASQAVAGGPKVLEMSPRNGATQVDPDTRELRVVFDCDMQTSGYSFCGGGPSFPKGVGQPRWVDKRTVVLKVRLQPDHDYALSLNCPAAKSFQSADGVPLQPTPWSFSTASKAPKRSEADQEALNARSLDQLMEVLRNYYSYRDLRGVDWAAEEKERREKIVAARSTRSWVKRTAKMLSAAEDMHLWLTFRDVTTHTFKRKVRPNFDLEGVKAALPDLRQRNSCVFTARTDDNIGYIMIGTLSRDQTEQLEQVEGFLKELKDCNGLIVDLRPNGGGAEPLAMPIAAWFVSGTKTYAKHVLRDPNAASGFSEPYERTITGNDDSQRFEKPAAVLSGPGMMSSAEAFLLMLKQGDNVTVIGEPTFGSSGNPQPHLLDNDVEVFVPSWKAMRPDGTCFEGQGIAPDIEVEASPATFKKRDPVIEAALKILRAGTKAAPGRGDKAATPNRVRDGR